MVDSSSSSRASDRRKAVQEAIRKLTTRAEAGAQAAPGQQDAAKPKTKQRDCRSEADEPAESRAMRQSLRRAAPASGTEEI